ncbi:MAG: hypothetical protein K6G47_14150 [Clostridia bacterium]|nr:hypothetical protein [Clostridia bacterium]
MKNKKLISIICLIICMLMIGTSLVACSSDGKKEKRKSSRAADEDDEDDEDEDEDDEDEDEDDEDKDEDDEDSEDDEDDEDEKEDDKDDKDMIPSDDVEIDYDEPIADISVEKFESVMMDVLECDESELPSYQGSDVGYDYLNLQVNYTGDYMDRFIIFYSEYADEDAARYFFDERVLALESALSHGFVDGNAKIADSLILFDADITYFLGEFPDYNYGGVFITGTKVISVYNYSDKDADRELIDELLKELDLKDPSRIPDAAETVVPPLYDAGTGVAFNSVSTDDFVAVVSENIGDSIQDYERDQEYLESELIYKGEGSSDLIIEMRTYTSPEEAQYDLDSMAAVMKFRADHDPNGGEVEIHENYVLLDGYFKAYYAAEPTYNYGGLYVFDNYMIEIRCISDEADDKAAIESLLDAFGFPKL